MSIIEELLTGDTTRLRHVTRYSSIPVVHKETVAEHVFSVAFYALVLGTMVNHPHRPERVINMESLLSKAVMHDIEESRTGDVFRPFKHANRRLKGEIELQADIEVQAMMIRMTQNASASEHFRHLWKTAKDDSLEGRLVAFCDFLSVLSYMTQEIRSGNTHMRNQHQTMADYVQLFDTPEYDFIRPWVVEVQNLTSQVIGDGSKHYSQ